LNEETGDRFDINISDYLLMSKGLGERAAKPCVSTQLLPMEDNPKGPNILNKIPSYYCDR
jgi:hypothetical protein